MTERRVVAPGSPEIDVPTVCALAVICYLAATLIHEGVGHAGFTLLLGGHVRQATSAACWCVTTDLSPWGARAVYAGGCVANLVLGFLALVLRAHIQRRPITSYALWLLGHVSLFIAFGYLMVFPFLGVGDWHDFVQGLPFKAVWQCALTVLGICGYAATMRHGRISFESYLGGVGVGRARRAFMLTTVPYLTGGLAEVLSAVSGSAGILVLLSAAPATFGGTIGLPILGRSVAKSPSSSAVESTGVGVPRSLVVQAFGVVAGVLYIFWFGPGLLR